MASALPTYSTRHQLPTGASVALDLLRAGFAFLVLITHARQHLLVPYEVVHDNGPLLIRTLYFFTAFGPSAVVGFFVLSGFLMTRTYLSDLYRGNVSPTEFLLNRLVRLYLVLIPTLILSALVVASSPSHADISLRTLVGTLLFLQPLGIEHFAGNTPLWSLGYEAYCYVVFCGLTCGIGALRRGRRASGLLWVAVGTLPLLGFPALMSHYMALWLLGAIFAALSKRITLSSEAAARWLGLFACVALGAFVRVRLGLPAILRDYVVAVPTAVVLCFLPSLKLAVPPWLKGGARHVAGASYSLYLTHYVLVRWVEVEEGSHRQPSAEALLFVLGVTLACVLFAWAFALCTERHTSAARVLLFRALRVKPVACPPPSSAPPP